MRRRQFLPAGRILPAESPSRGPRRLILKVGWIGSPSTHLTSRGRGRYTADMNLARGCAPAQATSPDSFLLGLFFGIASAVAYTVTNIFLRQLAVDCDPIFVSFVKAIPIATVASILVARSDVKGLATLPPRRLIWTLLWTALFTQLAGNVGFQWALGRIGLALTVPLSFGSLILGAALLGRVWLAEPISRRSQIAILLLIASIWVLSFAANDSSTSLDRERQTTASSGLRACAVGVACLSGFGYATANVAIRHSVTNGTSLSTTLLFISMTGVVSLGLLSVVRSRFIAAHTDAGDLLTMFFAGVFNAAAFYSLAKSLQLLPVLQVNLLIASQVATAAVCGIILFGEPGGVAQIGGVALTVAGLLLVKGR